MKDLCLMRRQVGVSVPRPTTSCTLIMVVYLAPIWCQDASLARLFSGIPASLWIVTDWTAQAMQRHSSLVTNVKLMSDSSGLNSIPQFQPLQASAMLHRPMLTYQQKLLSHGLLGVPLARRDSMGAVHVARSVNHAVSATRLTHCIHQQHLLR